MRFPGWVSRRKLSRLLLMSWPVRWRLTHKIRDGAGTLSRSASGPSIYESPRGRSRSWPAIPGERFQPYVGVRTRHCFSAMFGGPAFHATEHRVWDRRWSGCATGPRSGCARSAFAISSRIMSRCSASGSSASTTAHFDQVRSLSNIAVEYRAQFLLAGNWVSFLMGRLRTPRLNQPEQHLRVNKSSSKCMRSPRRPLSLRAVEGVGQEKGGYQDVVKPRAPRVLPIG